MFITPTSSHKNRLGFALALVLALLAGGHWLGALCYSRGYDFFLWLYNAWLLSGGGAGIWPDWSPFSAAGQPAFKMAGFVDAAVLAGQVPGSAPTAPAPHASRTLLELQAPSSWHITELPVLGSRTKYSSVSEAGVGEREIAGLV